MRNAVQKIGRAIERVDDPAMGLVAALMGAAFLAEEAVIGPRLGESSRTISSARLSAAVTKLRGPLSETCNCSTSPRSRLRLRPARCAALIMTLMTAE